MKHRIALVSDFFYPNVGGVENHIYLLAQNLKRLGHHVVVITHAYKERVGVRYLSNKLKVFYLPILDFVATNSWPGFYSGMPLMREIFIGERIEIVHSHQTASSLGHEGLMHAKLLGLKTVFTDHSLFGFSDASNIHLNKLLKFTLLNIDMVIGVSNSCRDNLILRTEVEDEKIVAIPNAMEAKLFVPQQPSRGLKENMDCITVVVLSRLAYRKGVDLVARILPIACAKWENLNFVIGGDGPKRLLLEETIEKYDLQQRVTMLGSIPHHEVAKVLNRGEIFLNCSLTESFCIAILEAASCGLLVVSTNVGGVPEVLPPDMIYFPKKEAVMLDELEGGNDHLIASLIDALERAMRDIHKVDRMKNHEILKEMYSWKKVAEMTDELVYSKIKKSSPTKSSNDGLLKILANYRLMGPTSGIIGIWLVALDFILLCFLNWYRPKEEILRDKILLDDD